MRLRSVIARDMRDGMRRVRDELGEDAIIVSTEEIENGVLITAATDRPPPPETENEPPPPEEPVADAQTSASGPSVSFAGLGECLSFHGVPAHIAKGLLSSASASGIDSPVDVLAAALDQSIGFSTLVPARIRRPLMLVGEAGAGKTVTLARIAAEAKIEGRNVIAASADTARAGGTGQLAAFMRAIDVDLCRIENARDLAELIDAAGPDGLVLIDTPAVNALASELSPVTELLSDRIEPLLVLPAGMQPEDAAEAAKIYGERLGVRRLVATKTDAARRYGAVVSAASAGRISVAGLSASRRMADGIQAVGAAALATLLLNQMASSTDAYRTLDQARESQ